MQKFWWEIHVWVGNTKIPQFWMGGPPITYAIYEWCDCEGLPQRSSSGNVVNDGVNHGVHQLSRRKPHRMTIWGDYQWTMCISSWLCRFATLDLQDFWVRAEGRECDTPQERSQVRRVSCEAGDPEDLLWASFEVMVPRLNFRHPPHKTIEDRHKTIENNGNATRITCSGEPPGITPASLSSMLSSKGWPLDAGQG